MKRIHLLVALAGLALALPLAATSAKRPDHIDLPNGWQPEGIAIKANSFYVGSIPTGRVWKGNLRTGQGAELVPNRGRRAIGVEVDHRNRLWVAGGPTGDGYVYNASTGADIAQFNFTDESATFVNDVVVTKRAAWFTDSMRAFLYKVPIGPNGALGTPQAVPLTGDIVYQSGFNVNGIDATPERQEADHRPVEHRQAVQGQPERRGPPDQPRRRDRVRRRPPSPWEEALCRRP